jgi:hypothetical protein
MENIEREPWYKEEMKIRMKMKRSRSQENLTVSKPIKDSKKKVSISAQNQNQDGKVLKENKCKSNTNSHKVCYCSPTTHEGSFKCRHHRISATKKSEELINVRCSKFASKSQLSRFGRVASAECGSQLNSTI